MKFFYTIVLTLMTSLVFSQGKIEGKVVEAESKAPIVRVKVKLVSPTFERIVNTDAAGNYVFENIRTGSYTLVVSEPGYFENSQDIDYVDGENMVVPDIAVEKQQQGKDMNNEVPTVDQSDDDGNGGGGNTAVASLLNSSRDIFVSNSMFGLGQGGFRNRGFRNQDQTMYINGIPMENIIRGNEITFNDFSGMNDVLRSRNNYYGIKAIPFSFGETTNNVDVDAEAINQRKGLRVSQWFSNRNFTTRTAVTYSTGLLKNNFAFSGSLSFRGAKEGYTPGTAMQSYSAYFSVSKLWSQKLNSSLSIFGTDNKRAVGSPSTKEFYALAGSNFYNPNWGYLNGEKKSGSIRRDNVPMIVFSNDFKPSNKTHINISAAYQFGKRYQERIDWYNSNNPSPTYYKNAPSYYNDNPTLYNEMLNAIKADPNQLQIDWKGLYESNYANYEYMPGQTSGTKQRRATYLLENEVSAVSNVSFNVTGKHQLNNKVDLNGGVLFQMNNTNFYRQVADLMGADYYVNVNLFAQRQNPGNPDAVQNDLNNPNQVLKVGDKYGYNYKANAMNITAWGQSTFTFKRFDAFVALKLETNSYSREGLFKNGAYAANSFGKSPTSSFMNVSAKGGVTYKMNGKNYFSLNAARWNNAPQFQQVYLLPRTTNLMDPNAKSMTITGGELAYFHRGATLKANVTAFYNISQNETDFRMFYTELANSFGTLLMKDMNKRYMGVEMAVESKIGTTGITATAIANIGDYVYTNRPTATFYYDNFDNVAPAQTVYFNGLHIASGPQIAGMFKMNYNSKQFWSASLSVNYFDKIYADPSPQRRTTEAVDNVPVGSDLYNKILTQEKLPSAVTVDAYFRKSFMLNKYIKSIKKRMYFDVSANISNILDKKDFATSSNEQMRFDFSERNPDKFPNKYFYMMGRSFYVNFIFRL
jgi:hypothetical protein